MPLKIKYSERIVECAEELEDLARSQKHRQNTDRLRYLRYLKTGEAKSQGQAGALVGIGLRQSQTWWQQYKNSGLSGLLLDFQPHYIGKLSSVEISRLLQYLDGDQALTQQQVADYLGANMRVHYTQAGIHYVFKRLQVKLKTGRPSNIRKDVLGAEAFKKNA